MEKLGVNARVNALHAHSHICAKHANCGGRTRRRNLFAPDHYAAYKMARGAGCDAPTAHYYRLKTERRGPLREIRKIGILGNRKYENRQLGVLIFSIFADVSYLRICYFIFPIWKGFLFLFSIWPGLPGRTAGERRSSEKLENGSVLDNLQT